MSTEDGGAHGESLFDPCAGVLMSIRPRRRDLGGFEVGRVLPAAQRRMVGPFIFFDEMGPANFAPGAGIDVRPHPHVRLATITYLFDGAIRHRDSIGSDLVIRPGDVNLMAAGAGVVHSERTPDDERAAGHRLHGIQCWIALPEGDATIPAHFERHPHASLPAFRLEGAYLRLIAGDAFGRSAPTRTYSPMFYIDAQATEGSRLSLPPAFSERAIYLVSGAVSVNGARRAAGEMLVFAEDADPQIIALEPCRAMLLGGDSVGARRIWWNFIASDEADIDAARAQWMAAAAAGFNTPPFTLPAGETEFIPAPEK